MRRTNKTHPQNDTSWQEQARKEFDSKNGWQKTEDKKSAKLRVGIRVGTLVVFLIGFIIAIIISKHGKLGGIWITIAPVLPVILVFIYAGLVKLFVINTDEHNNKI